MKLRTVIGIIVALSICWCVYCLYKQHLIKLDKEYVLQNKEYVYINDSAIIKHIVNVSNEVEFLTYKKLKEGEMYNEKCKTCHDNLNETNTQTCPFYLTTKVSPDTGVYYVAFKEKTKTPKKITMEDDEWLLILYMKKFSNN